MSETMKTKSNNTINYIVFGKEKGKNLVVSESKQQAPVHMIPGIPMEIAVEPHSFEIASDGTIIRKDENGKKLPGKVTDKKVVEAVKKEQETIR